MNRCTQRKIFWLPIVCCGALFCRNVAQVGVAAQAPKAHGAATIPHGLLLYSEDFAHGLKDWKVEQEKPGSVVAHNGVLDVDVPAGATLWFRPELQGPILIEYQARVIVQGGPNDRGSDLNCFWMATDPHSASSVIDEPRHGAFAEYNALNLYYVGLGGNGNTTTRFRRYIGSATERPLLPEDDLSSPEFLIHPNQTQTIDLLADGQTIAFYRDGRRIFFLHDAEPYTRGWFALRTTRSHIQISHLRIYRAVD